MNNSARRICHRKRHLSNLLLFIEVNCPLPELNRQTRMGIRSMSEGGRPDRDMKLAEKIPRPKKSCGKRVLPPKGCWPVITTVRMRLCADEVVVIHEETCSGTRSCAYGALCVAQLLQLRNVPYYVVPVTDMRKET